MNSTRLFVIGDSISIGYGPFLKAVLPEQFSYDRKRGEALAKLNLDIPQGANGGNTDMVCDYLNALIEDGDFPHDVLMINAGLHDIKRTPWNPAGVVDGELAVSFAGYRENLGTIVEQAAELGCELIWVNTTPVDDAMHAARGCGFDRLDRDVDELNAIAAEVMGEYGVPVLDLHGLMMRLSKGGPIFRDGVHFTEAICREQAAFIAGWLSRWVMVK